MRTMIVTLVLAAALPALAQSPAPAPASPQKSLASTLEVYVFPTAGQDASQQSQDEAECYGWAVQNTGTDPFDLAKQAEQVGRGAGAAGAVRGAAMGALIGEIASDDAGKGAAYGAAAGAIIARRQTRRAKAEASKQVEQQSAQAQQHTAEQIENFKKAFSVCLEAKDYMVKY